MSLSQSSDNEDAGNTSFTGNEVIITPSQSTKDLENMSLEQLNEYQSKISREFKSLSKEYLKKRLSRVNVMLEKLNSSIKLASANDKSWLKIYNFEIETINNIMTNTEDLIMVKNKTIPNKPDLLKSMDEYEEELQEIFTNLQSPFDFDDTFKYDNGEIANQLNNSHSQLSRLPFPYLFNQSFKPHRDELRSISLEKDYQSQLIRNNCQNNSTIAWNQYYTKLNQHKNRLLTETQSQLNQLYKDYHHLNDSRNEELQDRYYFRSLISPQYLSDTINDSINITNTNDLDAIMKTNHDSNYVELDTRLKPKNKIELSMVREEDKRRDNLVASTHTAIKRRYSAICKPREDTAVATEYTKSQSQLEDDVQLIRNKIRRQNEDRRPGSTAGEDDSLNGLSLRGTPQVEKEGDKQDEIDKASKIDYGDDRADDEYEEVVEEYDVEEDMTPAQLEERKIYKHVLNQNNSALSTFKMLKLPPMENFPRL
ncbi:hypothetical protein KGF57_002880 [Candida theae]|uniref:Uncharacterized protein n=1 Tax=Candida theae TaxID=1198502 RepID=A0AAD5BEC3_9ASCO|nr:uncharacterized protein KGF57_002880 [Candida theae]KAI5958072.1 hypothetical protein KGF57_002880 [Candida theae]